MPPITIKVPDAIEKTGMGTDTTFFLKKTSFFIKEIK